MTSALDLLMDSDSTAETTTLLESNGICTIDSRTRTIFVPPEIVVGAVQSDKNAERIKFSCPKIVGDNLDLSKFSIRINFENVSSVDPDISIKDQYICEDASINEDNITFSWVIGKNAARYMGTIRFIVCAVKTDSDSNISIEWNTTVAQIPVLEGIEVDQPSLDENNKDVINQLLAITKTASDEAVKNVNSAKEQAITDIQNVSQPDKTLTVEGGIADAKATGNAISSLREDIDGVFKKTYSRNLLKYNNLKQGFYLNDKGEVTANSLFAFIEDYLSVDENTYYTLSRYNKENRDYIGGANCIVCFYNSEKEFLSYKQIIDENLGKFITPLNCKYIRLSGLAEWFNDELLQLEKGTTSTNYVEYEMKMTLSKEAVPDSVESKTVVNHLIVKKDGTGNFIKIQDAINSINDSSKNNRYIIHVYEGEYNLGEDFTESDISNPSFSGIFVPDFVTIKGEGNRDNIILFVELTEYNEKISALNLSNTSELEGITVRGTRTRYCVHDDFAKNNISYKRSVKNCKFIAIDTYYNTCYGSGCKEGADWKFENCIFDASKCNDSNGKIAFLNHNNINWQYTSSIKFINCNFIGRYVANNNGVITLRTLSTNANNMETNMSLYGCDIGGGIVLKEESEDVYGSGILFKINGFANKNLEYSIVNTDGKDYSGNVNLIN